MTAKSVVITDCRKDWMDLGSIFASLVVTELKHAQAFCIEANVHRQQTNDLRDSSRFRSRHSLQRLIQSDGDIERS